MPIKQDSLVSLKPQQMLTCISPCSTAINEKHAWKKKKSNLNIYFSIKCNFTFVLVPRLSRLYKYTANLLLNGKHDSFFFFSKGAMTETKSWGVVGVCSINLFYSITSHRNIYTDTDLKNMSYRASMTLMYSKSSVVYWTQWQVSNMSMNMNHYVLYYNVSTPHIQWNIWLCSCWEMDQVTKHSQVQKRVYIKNVRKQLLTVLVDSCRWAQQSQLHSVCAHTSIIL